MALGSVCETSADFSHLSPDLRSQHQLPSGHCEPFGASVWLKLQGRDDLVLDYRFSPSDLEDDVLCNSGLRENDEGGPILRFNLVNPFESLFGYSCHFFWSDFPN